MADLREMIASTAAEPGADLDAIPTECSCGDAAHHGRRVVAAHAEDAEDARQLMQMLGLLPSPAPVHGTTEFGERSKAKRRNPTTTNP